MSVRKISAIFGLFIAFSQAAFAQINFPGLPSSTWGDDLADTVLNTQSIRHAARSKKITAINDRPNRSTYIKVLSVDTSGKIVHSISCLPKFPQMDIELCMSRSFEYHPSGHIASERFTDTKGNALPKQTSTWKKDTLYSITYIDSSDYILICETFDANGRVRSHERIDQRGHVLESSNYFYHADGLPDSIVNSVYGTLHFVREKQDANTRITMTHASWFYSWVYNAKGQCTKYAGDFHLKPEPVPYNWVHSYHYNDDGTLSHIVVQSNRQETFTIRYTYEYYPAHTGQHRTDE